MRAPWIAPMLAVLPATAFAQTVDLVTASANVSPTTVELGTMLTVTGTFGGVFVGSVAYRVVVSSDGVLDPSDTPLYTGTVLFTGDAGPTAFTASFPMGVVPAATWNVFVEVDSNHQVAESDETNNALAAAQQLTMRGADLRVGDIQGPGYGFAGGPYQIDLTITNEGPVAATNFHYDYYYSDTPQIRVFSTHLAQMGPVSVPPGGQLRVSDMVMLPTSTATGYIGVILDQLGEVPETSLGNNIGRIPQEISIVAPSPDLSGRFIDVPAEGAVGEQLAITRSLANSGVVDATVEYAFYLSTDQTITTADVELGRFSAMIPADDDDYAIDLMNVPFQVAPGSYYVGLIVDPDETFSEPDRDDNTVVGPQIQIYQSAIQFLTNNLPNATVGVSYQVGVYASGPLIVTFSVSDGALPDGLTLDAAGLISGTPTKTGQFDFTLRGHAGTAVADRRFSIRVIETTVPLEVVEIGLPTGVRGRAYEAQMVAVGGQPPYRWSPVGEIPFRLDFDTDGRLSGTPDLVGAQPFAVRVEDAIGATAGHDFLVRVVSPEDTLAIAQTVLPNAIINQDYCKQSTIRFEATRGVEPYVWSAVGDLPPGITLSGAGDLCGTPTRVGRFPFTVRVHDQTGLSDSSLFVLVVDSEVGFVLSTTTLPDGNVDEPYQAALDVGGGEPPVAFSRIEGAGDLPPGLTLASDGQITGTPTEPGVFAFVAHVVDNANRADIQPLSIAVLAPKRLSEDKGGCACYTGRANTGSLALVLMFGLLLLRRRTR